MLPIFCDSKSFSKTLTGHFIMFCSDIKHITYSWTQALMNRATHCVVNMTCTKLHWNWRKTKCLYIAGQGTGILPIFALAKWKHEWLQWKGPPVYFPQEGHFWHKYKSSSVLLCWLRKEWEYHCYWVSSSTMQWVVSSSDANLKHIRKYCQPITLIKHILSSEMSIILVTQNVFLIFIS